jgi:hypothetical protein
MKRTILTTALCALALISHAQEEKEKDKHRLLNFRGNSFQLLDPTEKRILKRTMKDDEASSYFQEFPTSLDFYNEYKRFKKSKNTLRTIGAGGMIAGFSAFVVALVIDLDNSISEGYSESKENTAAIIGVTGAGVFVAGATTFLIQFPIASKAKKQAIKAVDEYNYQTDEKYSFGLGANKNGIGLVLNF